MGETRKERRKETKAKEGINKKRRKRKEEMNKDMEQGKTDGQEKNKGMK